MVRRLAGFFFKKSFYAKKTISSTQMNVSKEIIFFTV